MLDNNHEAFSPPKENCTLWRYMDFTKLLSILESKKILFVRADKFEDPYEGSLPKLAVEAIKNPAFNGGIPREHIEMYLEHIKNTPVNFYINCWFAAEHESAAMWKLYLQSPEGIAIRSDHDTLCLALERSPLKIRTTKVKYVDYERATIPIGNIFFPFVHKRMSFSHENELRAIVWSFEDVNKPLIPDDSTLVGVDIDPGELIKGIHVSPSAPKWFGELVEQVVRRYGLSCSVEKSNLYDRPSY